MFGAGLGFREPKARNLTGCPALFFEVPWRCGMARRKKCPKCAKQRNAFLENENALFRECVGFLLWKLKCTQTARDMAGWSSNLNERLARPFARGGHCSTDQRNEAIHELVAHYGVVNGQCKPDWPRIATILEERAHGRHEPEALRICYARWLKNRK